MPFWGIHAEKLVDHAVEGSLFSFNAVRFQLFGQHLAIRFKRINLGIDDRCRRQALKIRLNQVQPGIRFLAALALLRLRDRHDLATRIAGAVFFFGLYDFSGTSMVRAAGLDRLILHGPTVLSTLRKLTPKMTDEERRKPSISPLYADLRSLPPALFVVGEEDMLLEENQRMEERWRTANGNASLLLAPASPHAFDRLNTAIAQKVDEYVDRWITDRFDFFNH